MKKTGTSDEKALFTAQLKKVPLFSGLEQKHLELIQSECREVRVPGGKVILRQDERSFDLYVILDGSVKISLVGGQGKEVALAILKAGDFFGELSLFDKKPRSANVQAITGARMLKLERKSILHLIKEDPDIAVNLLSEAAGRLRKADDTIMTLSFLDVCGRVAKVLLEMAETAGEKIDSDFVRIPGPRHRDIAEHVGASREAVTKAMKSLAGNGQIIIEEGTILIAKNQFEVG